MEGEQWIKKKKGAVLMIECDCCGRYILPDTEQYIVYTDYGEECYCEKCAMELLQEQKTDSEILDKFFLHRTVGCDD